MKTKKFLTCFIRPVWAFSRLACVLLLATSFGQAQDPSCKVVADAQILLAKTLHHVFSTDVRDGRSVASESISTLDGVFWGANGVWHRSTSSMQEFSRATAGPEGIPRLPPRGR
jgi:hypothetical protein